MEQTSLNIGTIGQKLQSARQAKGLSLSAAAENTRILAKVIETMEADDFGSISAPIYARGFLKMYAQYLGLDPVPLVEEYGQLYTHKPKPLLSKDVEQSLMLDANDAAPDMTATAPPSRPPKVFGAVGGGDSVSGVPMKVWIIAGAALLLVIILLSVTQCSGAEEPGPVEGEGAAALVPRELLFDKAPDVYLIKPGEVEVRERGE